MISTCICKCSERAKSSPTPGPALCRRCRYMTGTASSMGSTSFYWGIAECSCICQTQQYLRSQTQLQVSQMQTIWSLLSSIFHFVSRITPNVFFPAFCFVANNLKLDQADKYSYCRWQKTDEDSSGSGAASNICHAHIHDLRGTYSKDVEWSPVPAPHHWSPEEL